MSVLTKLRQGESGTGAVNDLMDEIEENYQIVNRGASAPVDAVVASGTLTVDTQPTVGDTMTIGTKVFTFTVGAAAADGEIFVGADLPAAKVNIVAAINGSDSVNTASAFVTAAAFSTNDCTLTALVGGVIGNATVTTETFDEGTNVFAAATLTSGVNGTVPAAAYAMLVAATRLYVNISGTTIADAVWKEATLA